MLKQGLELKEVIARKETVAKGTKPSFDRIPSLNANTDQAQFFNFPKIAFPFIYSDSVLIISWSIDSAR